MHKIISIYIFLTLMKSKHFRFEASSQQPGPNRDHQQAKQYEHQHRLPAQPAQLGPTHLAGYPPRYLLWDHHYREVGHFILLQRIVQQN